MSRKYTVIEKYKHEICNGGVAIEIGSDHGEGSTYYFNELFKQLNVKFYTIDIDKKRIESLKNIVEYSVCSRGEEWTRANKELISFAYLDNYDWVYPALLHNSEEFLKLNNFYKSYQMKLDNKKSQEIHLEQLKNIVKTAAPVCYLMIDDTYYFNNKWDGKGGSGVPYLLEHNWELIENLDGLVLFKKYN